MKAESLRTKLIEYARFGGEAIARRLERARISALLEGGVVLAENNVAADISYGRDPQLQERLVDDVGVDLLGLQGGQAGVVVVERGLLGLGRRLLERRDGERTKLDGNLVADRKSVV